MVETITFGETSPEDVRDVLLNPARELFIERLATHFGQKPDKIKTQLEKYEKNFSLYHNGRGNVDYETLSPDVVLNNCTEYFRYRPQCHFIARHVVHHLRKGEDVLIVSAPCSSGDELVSVGAFFYSRSQTMGISFQHAKFLGLEGSLSMLRYAGKEIDSVRGFRVMGIEARACDFLSGRTELREQNFKHGLGLKAGENPRVILMNNILYYLEKEHSASLLIETLEQVHPRQGCVVTTNRDVKEVGDLFGLSFDKKKKILSGSGRNYAEDSVILLRNGEHISVWGICEYGQLHTFLGTRTLDQLQKSAEEIQSSSRLQRAPLVAVESMRTANAKVAAL